MLTGFPRKRRTINLREPALLRAGQCGASGQFRGDFDQLFLLGVSEVASPAENRKHPAVRLLMRDILDEPKKVCGERL